MWLCLPKGGHDTTRGRQRWEADVVRRLLVEQGVEPNPGPKLPPPDAVLRLLDGQGSAPVDWPSHRSWCDDHNALIVRPEFARLVSLRQRQLLDDVAARNALGAYGDSGWVLPWLPLLWGEPEEGPGPTPSMAGSDPDKRSSATVAARAAGLAPLPPPAAAAPAARAAPASPVAPAVHAVPAEPAESTELAASAELIAPRTGSAPLPSPALPAPDFALVGPATPLASAAHAAPGYDECGGLWHHSPPRVPWPTQLSPAAWGWGAGVYAGQQHGMVAAWQWPYAGIPVPWPYAGTPVPFEAHGLPPSPDTPAPGCSSPGAPLPAELDLEASATSASQAPQPQHHRPTTLTWPAATRRRVGPGPDSPETSRGCAHAQEAGASVGPLDGQGAGDPAADAAVELPITAAERAASRTTPRHQGALAPRMGARQGLAPPAGDEELARVLQGQAQPMSALMCALLHEAWSRPAGSARWNGCHPVHACREAARRAEVDWARLLGKLRSAVARRRGGGIFREDGYVQRETQEEILHAARAWGDVGKVWDALQRPEPAVPSRLAGLSSPTPSPGSGSPAEALGPATCAPPAGVPVDAHPSVRGTDGSPVTAGSASVGVAGVPASRSAACMGPPRSAPEPTSPPPLGAAAPTPATPPTTGQAVAPGPAAPAAGRATSTPAAPATGHALPDAATACRPSPDSSHPTVPLAPSSPLPRPAVPPGRPATPLTTPPPRPQAPQTSSHALTSPVQVAPAFAPRTSVGPRGSTRAQDPLSALPRASLRVSGHPLQVAGQAAPEVVARRDTAQGHCAPRPGPAGPPPTGPHPQTSSHASVSAAAAGDGAPALARQVHEAQNAPRPRPGEATHAPVASLSHSLRFSPVLVAVAVSRGQQVSPEGLMSLARARADYATWKASLHAATAGHVKDWNDLIATAGGVVAGRPIPIDATGCVGAQAQEELLNIRNDSLPDDLSVLGLWTADRLGQASSPPPPPVGTAPASAQLHQPQPLDRAEILFIRAGAYGPTVVDIPRHSRALLAGLLVRWMEEAIANLRAGLGTMPTLLWAPRLLLSGSPTPHQLTWRMREAAHGKWRDVLNDLIANRRPRHGAGVTPAKRQAASRTLFSRGEVTKGLAYLGRAQHGRGQAPQPTEEQLRAKFPQPTVSLPPPLPFTPTTAHRVSELRHDIERAATADESLTPRDWVYWVRRALMKPRHSCAPGPDGLRYSHLRQLLVLPNVGVRLLQLTAELVDLVASGRFCPSLTDLAVTAVPKPGGGVRPIGVSSIWRRIPIFIASSCLSFLTPALTSLGQLATAPAGPQVFARRAQRCAGAGLIVARMDIMNAYNALDRHRLLEILDALVRQSQDVRNDTGALKAIRAAYSSSEEIFWARGDRDPVIFANESGITQGCPAGAFAFGAVMADILGRTQHALKEVGIEAGPLPPANEPLPDASAVGFAALHDDVVFASADQNALLQAVEVFKLQLAAANLRLGLGDGKSVLLVDDAVQIQQDLLDAFEGCRKPVVKCAGVPIHVPTAAARNEANELLTSTVQDCLQPLHALRLAHPQDIVKVLVVAGARSRVQYHAACTPDEAVWAPLCQEGDSLTRELLAHALGDQASSTTDRQFLIAVLPAADGGLGVRSCTLESQVDIRAAKVIRARDTGSSDDLENAQAAQAADLAKLHRMLRSIAWTAGNTDLELVQLSHQSRPEVAGLWTANASVVDRTLMPPRVAAKALALHLLAPPVEVVTHCGEPRHFRAGSFRGKVPSVGPSGPERQHLYTCPLLMTSRHTAVCHAAREVAHSLGPRSVLLEQACDDQGLPVDAARRRAGVSVPGDIVVQAGHGPHIFADVTVSLLSAPLKIEADALRAAKPVRMRIAEAANARKTRPGSHGEAAMAAGAHFVPMAFSAFGAVDTTTNVSLGVFARGVDSWHEVPPALGEQPLWRRLLAAMSCAVRAKTAEFALRFGPDHEHTEPGEAFSKPCPTLRGALASSRLGRTKLALIRRILFLGPGDEDEPPVDDGADDDDDELGHGVGEPAPDTPPAHAADVPPLDTDDVSTVSDSDAPAATHNDPSPTPQADAGLTRPSPDGVVPALARMAAEGLQQLVFDGTAVETTDIHEPNRPTAPSGTDTSVATPRNHHGHACARVRSPPSSHPSGSSSSGTQRQNRFHRVLHNNCAARRAHAMHVEGLPARSPRYLTRMALYDHQLRVATGASARPVGGGGHNDRGT